MIEIYSCMPDILVCIHICMYVSTCTGIAADTDVDIHQVFLECPFLLQIPQEGGSSLGLSFHLQSSAQIFCLVV